MFSSLLDKTVNNVVVVGEVGLGGEIRTVSQIDKRIQEAERLGFKKIIIPKNNLKGLKATGNIKVSSAASLIETINEILK